MSGEVKAKKLEYMNKLVALLEEHDRFFLAVVDNIASSHMQEIRQSLRGKAVFLLGKNTLMRKAIRMHLDEHPEWEMILPKIKGNVAMVFTKMELDTIKPLLLESRVPAAAKAGIFAPINVTVPKQITILEPTKTSFFASLDIATKITRGSIEILNDVKICTAGERVGSSQATLLQLLNIRPFSYGLQLTAVYDAGCVFAAELLDKTAADLIKTFSIGVGTIAALSLGSGYPTLAAFPHVVLGAFKNLVSISLGCDYVFEEAKAIKEMVENPDAFVSAAPVAAEAAVEEEEAPVEDEESSEPEFDDLFAF